MPRLVDVDEIIKKISEESMAKHIPEYCLLQTDEKCRLALHGQIIKQFLLDAPVIEVPRWIPVTERLPEKEGRYLCVVKIGRSGAVYVQVMNGDRYGFSLEHIYNDDVTHWMPLPKPPEDGGNNDA